MEELINQFANVGFPIVVTAFLLIKMENKLEQLNTTIIKLSEAIDELCNSQR